MTSDSYEADSKTKDAVERNFEIVGEAASRIPDDFKKLHPTIEWRIIKDFRNFIIHEYFGINNQSDCLGYHSIPVAGFVAGNFQFNLNNRISPLNLCF